MASNILQKVTGVAAIGTFIEWYDLYIALVISIQVWPLVFFSKSISPTLALALSLATFGVSLMARPLGASVFGHFGDKLGRKRMLVFTLLTMGIGTFGIAVLPTYSTIGIFAPALLVAFRIVQGLGIGGEIGGATTWVSEFAAKFKTRGFWTSIVSSTAGIGVIASFGLVFLLNTYLGHAALVAWAWRIPFFIGVAVLFVGALVRSRFLDSPMFKAVESRRKISASPMLEVFRKHWKTITILILALLSELIVAVGILLSYAQSYMAATLKLGNGTYYAALLIGVAIVASCIIGGALSDRFGRKPLVVAGILIMLAWTYPFFLILHGGNLLQILLASVIYTFGVGFVYGPYYSLLAESFPTRVRYSGVGVSYQLSSLVIGLITTFLIPVLLATLGSGAIWPVAWISVALGAISLVASLMIKDRHDRDLE